MANAAMLTVGAAPGLEAISLAAVPGRARRPRPPALYHYATETEVLAEHRALASARRCACHFPLAATQIGRAAGLLRAPLRRPKAPEMLPR